MIKALNITSKIETIEFIKDVVRQSDDIEKRQAVILPTERSLRELSYSNFLYSDIYTIKQFSSFIRTTNKVYIPDELRVFYMRQAGIELCNEGNFTLFGNNSETFLDSLTSFQNVFPSIISFYREIASELLDVNNLYSAGLYSDYESQVRSLMLLWDRYIKIINQLGFTDKWEEVKKLKLNYNFINRYHRIIIVVAGYLTMAEVEELRMIGENTELLLIFTFVGKKDDRYLQYEKLLDITLVDSYDVELSENNCKIYETTSVLTQLNLIFSQASYYNDKLNIPYSKMGIILPDDKLRSYFLELDMYELFDITGNEEISYSAVYQLLNELCKINFLEDDGSYIEINDIILIINAPFIKRMVDVEKYLSSIENEIRSGKFYINTGKLSDIVCVSDIKNLYRKDTITPIEVIVVFENILSSFKPYLIDEERKTFNDVVTLLSRAKIIYKDIDVKVTVEECMNMILSILKNLSIQTPKGTIAVSGILESRCLNYDIVFVVELLDSYFPPKNKKELFLNTEMRKELNLPTFIDRDNLIKNYLLQIMAQAKATIIYYSNIDISSRSRFIDELIFKYKLTISKYDSSYISTKVSDRPFRFNNDNIIIEKTDEILTRIHKLTISATSLDIFHKCSLQFYFKYILGIREVDKPISSLSNNYIGTAFHKAIEVVKSDDKLLDNKERFIFEFKNEFYNSINQYHSYQFSHVNKIMINSCVMVISDIYDIEVKRRNEGYKTISLEQDILIENYNNFSLKGKIDRVDKKNDFIELFDYKFKDAPLNEIKLIDEENYHKFYYSEFDNKKVSLQLPFYTLLLKLSRRYNISKAYIYILKDNVMFYNIFDTSRLPEFEIYFNDILKRLCDKEVPFVAEPNAEFCSYCLYKDICSR